MRIDTVGRTGHERTVIFVRIDRKILQMIRQDNPNLIHLVAERTIQHLKLKRISLLQLINVCKKLCRRESPVSGDHTVRPLPADRQGGALDMSHGNLENRRIRSMIFIWYI